MPSAVTAGYCFRLFLFSLCVQFFWLMLSVCICYRLRSRALHPLVSPVVNGAWLRWTEEVFGALLDVSSTEGEIYGCCAVAALCPFLHSLSPSQVKAKKTRWIRPQKPIKTSPRGVRHTKTKSQKHSKPQMQPPDFQPLARFTSATGTFFFTTRARRPPPRPPRAPRRPRSTAGARRGRGSARGSRMPRRG